eukprot:COSAG02_NODE_7035_length_3216_cov_5.385627_1_plen_35_part_00
MQDGKGLYGRTCQHARGHSSPQPPNAGMLHTSPG